MVWTGLRTNCRCCSRDQVEHPSYKTCSLICRLATLLIDCCSATLARLSTLLVCLDVSWSCELVMLTGNQWFCTRQHSSRRSVVSALLYWLQLTSIRPTVPAVLAGASRVLGDLDRFAVLRYGHGSFHVSSSSRTTSGRTRRI